MRQARAKNLDDCVLAANLVAPHLDPSSYQVTKYLSTLGVPTIHMLERSIGEDSSMKRLLLVCFCTLVLACLGPLPVCAQQPQGAGASQKTKQGKTPRAKRQ